MLRWLLVRWRDVKRGGVHLRQWIRVPGGCECDGRQPVPREELLHWRRDRSRDVQHRGLLVSGGLPDRHDERVRGGALRQRGRRGQLHFV